MKATHSRIINRAGILYARRVSTLFTNTTSSMHIVLLANDSKETFFLEKNVKADLHKVTYQQTIFSDTQLKLVSYDLILVDANFITNVNNYALLQLKEVRKKTPVIIYNICSEVLIKTKFPESINLYYLAKPVKIQKILLLIAELENKQSNNNDENIIIADLQINLYQKTVIRAGKLIKLTIKEFMVLKVLMLHKKQIVPRAAIAHQVWGTGATINHNLLNLYISYLRAKIDVGYSKQLIHTVVGLGYIIKD